LTVSPAPCVSSPCLSAGYFHASTREWNDWRWQQANRFTRAQDLERIPFLSQGDARELRSVIRAFPWAVTPYYLSLIRWEDPQDPLRRQVIPGPEEIGPPAGGSLDPLDEGEHAPAPGINPRYPDRAVLLATNRCSVFCRHCFRKRLWNGKETGEGPDRWQEGLRYLRAHACIRDVLVSGGDPLTLPDPALDALLGDIRRIPHVEVIRVGSRVPVVLPQRITGDLCRALDRHGPVWLVTQFNHPREITPEAASACERLLRAGIPVNNQTVLLKGVNDSTEIQTSLARGLLRIRVRPYYLHQCDRVTGAEHFRCPIERGIEIVQQMQGSVSGLAIPRFVVDLPGTGGKVPLQPGHLLWSDGANAAISSLAGERVPYDNPESGER
jgi:lysine 2,3-aminomutase